MQEKKKKEGGSKGAPEARVLSLTCIPQKYSHHLSWAETLGLCVRPPFLSLNRKEVSFVFFNCFIQHHKDTDLLHSPGYFPPLFRWMKQMMSRIKMSRAMAHMRPMNHPWVAMSTCLLATAGQEGEGERDLRWRRYVFPGRGRTIKATAEERTDNCETENRAKGGLLESH